MSGGHFEYQQYKIEEIANSIEQALERNEYEYSKKTLEEFKTAVKVLGVAYIYARRIDWLLSGDDGEDTFHERLKEELNDLNKKWED